MNLNVRLLQIMPYYLITHTPFDKLKNKAHIIDLLQAFRNKLQPSSAPSQAFFENEALECLCKPIRHLCRRATEIERLYGLLDQIAFFQKDDEVFLIFPSDEKHPIGKLAQGDHIDVSAIILGRVSRAFVLLGEIWPK